MPLSRDQSSSAGSTRSMPSSTVSPASSASARRTGSGGAISKLSSTRVRSAGDSSCSGSAGSLTKRTGSAESAKCSTTSGRALPTKSGKPSDVLNPRTTDPFSNSKSETSFAVVYNSGAIPCRLAHGSVRHKLTWSTPPADIHFDPTLILLAEGIRETVHPYTFVARTGFKELLQCDRAGEKASPLVPKLMQPLRLALSHKDGSVFEAGLEGLEQLSTAVGTVLNPHLKTVLPSVSKRSMDRKYKDKITSTLHVIEHNGGKESFAVIKTKIPTYSSIFT